MNEEVIWKKKKLEERICGLEKDIEELRGKARAYDHVKHMEISELKGKKEALEWVIEHGKEVSEDD